MGGGDDVEWYVGIIKIQCKDFHVFCMIEIGECSMH